MLGGGTGEGSGRWGYRVQRVENAGEGGVADDKFLA